MGMLWSDTATSPTSPRGQRQAYEDESNTDWMLIPERPAWHREALCRGTGPYLWFQERGESTEQAKEVCNHCPSCVPCLEYALEHSIKWGIWGSTSARERRRIARERREAA